MDERSVHHPIWFTGEVSVPSIYLYTCRAYIYILKVSCLVELWISILSSIFIKCKWRKIFHTLIWLPLHVIVVRKGQSIQIRDNQRSKRFYFMPGLKVYRNLIKIPETSSTFLIKQWMIFHRWTYLPALINQKIRKKLESAQLIWLDPPRRTAGFLWITVDQASNWATNHK